MLCPFDWEMVWEGGVGEEIVEVLKAGFGGRLDGRVGSRCQLEALVV